MLVDTVDETVNAGVFKEGVAEVELALLVYMEGVTTTIEVG